ncbi:hypothetical protein B0H19DRAFT_969970 [Mycena capillaripes]|nr:hypothetical protein B0H19DRAFT_969970 [Mycena capillaripes]
MLEALDTGKTRAVKALLDNGCTTTCIDRDYAKAEGFEQHELDVHIIARNADGTENARGKITHYVELIMTVGPHKERQRFLVTGLGKPRVFIGYDWLFKHNPEIDTINGLCTLLVGSLRASFLVHLIPTQPGSVTVFVGSQKDYKKCAQKGKRKKKEKTEKGRVCRKNRKHMICADLGILGLVRPSGRGGDNQTQKLVIRADQPYRPDQPGRSLILPDQGKFRAREKINL